MGFTIDTDFFITFSILKRTSSSSSSVPKPCGLKFAPTGLANLLFNIMLISANTDWESQAINALNDVLKIENKEGVAKNVILFVGDGMGISTINAARIYKGQKQGNTGEETVLEWEKFPNSAFSKVNIRLNDQATVLIIITRD